MELGSIQRQRSWRDGMISSIETYGHFNACIFQLTISETEY